MKRGGHNAKPAVTKRLRGTARPDRAKREPVVPGGVLMPSDQIDAQVFARDYWDHFLQTAPRGVLAPLDAPILERLCMALSLARQAMADVIANGMCYTLEKTGFVMQNPHLAIVNRQTEIARKLAGELGLPVTARARLDMPDQPALRDGPPGDPADDRRDDLERFLDLHPGRPIN